MDEPTPRPERGRVQMSNLRDELAKALAREEELHKAYRGLLDLGPMLAKANYEVEQARDQMEQLRASVVGLQVDIKGRDSEIAALKAERDALKAKADGLTDGLHIARREQEINLSRAEKAEAALAPIKVNLSTCEEELGRTQSALHSKEEQVKAMEKVVCWASKTNPERVHDGYSTKEEIGLAGALHAFDALTAKPQEGASG